MYLGVDLGTSGVKTVLMDDGQTIIASATAPLDVARPAPGWSEQNPDQWIVATRAAIAELKRSHGQALASVKGIGFSGHMHGATLIDKADQVLRPCILWNDTRSHAEAAQLDANPLFRSLSGNIVFPGFTAPKLVWVKNNEPDIFKRVAKVLLPKDYLRLWMTGDHVSEMSDASGTSWLDVGKRDWSPELLEASGMEPEHMPRLVEGSRASGTLRRELASEWGMGSRVIVAGGAGDNAATAIGLGTIEDGKAFISLGTSGVIFASNNSYRPNPDSAVHAFCHAAPDVWHQMGVILSATDALNWFSGITGRSAQELTDELGDELTPPGPVFLPYLSGERTPHNDAHIRGVLAGFSHQDDRPRITAAILQGVAFAFKDSLEALREAGTEVDQLLAAGGGSRSDHWLKVIATSLNVPIAISESGDVGAALGAARLGMVSTMDDAALSLCSAPDTDRLIEPDQDMRAAFDDAYATYKNTYPAIRSTLS